MKRVLQFLMLLSLIFLISSPVLALQFDLNYEFDGELPTTVTYATVNITENGGDLDFIVDYVENTLGVDADIHELYLNLGPEVFTNLEITTSNASDYDLTYTVVYPATVAGRAGAPNNLTEINFGPGDPTVQYISFTLSAEQDLYLSNLLPFSSNNIIDVNVAIHFQDTDVFYNSDSETIGGIPAPVPEPATMLLLGTGLVGLAGASRKKILKRRG